MRHFRTTADGWAAADRLQPMEADAPLHRALRRAFAPAVDAPVPEDLLALARRVGAALDGRAASAAVPPQRDAAIGRRPLHGRRHGR